MHRDDQRRCRSARQSALWSWPSWLLLRRLRRQSSRTPTDPTAFKLAHLASVIGQHPLGQRSEATAVAIHHHLAIDGDFIQTLGQLIVRNQHRTRTSEKRRVGKEVI